MDDVTNNTLCAYSLSLSISSTVDSPVHHPSSVRVLCGSWARSRPFLPYRRAVSSKRGCRVNPENEFLKIPFTGGSGPEAAATFVDEKRRRQLERQPTWKRREPWSRITKLHSGQWTHDITSIKIRSEDGDSERDMTLYIKKCCSQGYFSSGGLNIISFVERQSSSIVGCWSITWSTFMILCCWGY